MLNFLKKKTPDDHAAQERDRLQQDNTDLRAERDDLMAANTKLATAVHAFGVEQDALEEQKIALTAEIQVWEDKYHAQTTVLDHAAQRTGELITLLVEANTLLQNIPQRARLNLDYKGRIADWQARCAEMAVDGKAKEDERR